MKHLKHALFILGTLYAGNVFAQTILLVDDNIKVTAINGQEVKHGALQPLKRQFTLEAGRHVITARYDRMFDLPQGNHDYLKSGHITVSADLSDNQTYQLVMPNQPENYQSAKEYAKAPTLAITQQGQIVAQENIIAQRQGILSSLGNSLGGIFKRDEAVHANQKAIASLNTSSNSNTLSNNSSVNATPTSTMSKANQSNLDGFMQIWLNANEEEREKIRQWVQK